MGALLQITIYSLMELLQARNQAKQMARSTNQTTVQLSENNPLKFSPTPEEAMRHSVRTTDAKLPGRARRLYPRLRRSEVASVEDIRRRCSRLSRLVASVDPNAMAREIEGGGCVLARFEQEQIVGCVSDALEGASWSTTAARRSKHFMRHFADSYDRTETAGRK